MANSAGRVILVTSLCLSNHGPRDIRPCRDHNGIARFAAPGLPFPVHRQSQKMNPGLLDPCPLLRTGNRNSRFNQNSCCMTADQSTGSEHPDNGQFDFPILVRTDIFYPLGRTSAPSILKKTQFDRPFSTDTCMNAMRTMNLSRFSRFTAIWVTLLACAPCPAQDPQLKQALKIIPVHADAEDFETPSDEELASCTIEPSTDSMKLPGWIVKDGGGRMLRLFLDIDRDNKLDQWSFYRNGIEVYRDLDTNKNEKKDQHRWMATAGTRWGIDQDEDGKIDSWKIISGEEVAVEIFNAVKTGDRQRFTALLPTSEELRSLKLGETMHSTVEAALKKAAADFESFAKKQTAVKPASEFVHFGSSRPSLAIAGSNGLEQDVIVYDHATAVFETGEDLEQLSLGTIVQIGNAWRAIELPVIIDEKNPAGNGGLFVPLPGMGESVVTSENPGLNELFEKWQALEQKLVDAKPGAATERLQEERADALMELVRGSANGENRKNWARQLADTVTAAYAEGLFEGGLKKLAKLSGQLKDAGAESEVDYFAWTALSARYTRDFRDAGNDKSEATGRFMKALEAYIDEFPKSGFAAEAMMQLAIYTEVNSSGGDEKAVEWYTRLEKGFPENPLATRAAGARVRLTATGKQIPFHGSTFAGKPFNLDDRTLRGKIVVLYFWSTISPTSETDFDELQRLSAKYKNDLVIVGANLDSEKQDAETFLKTKPNASWINLFEPGGMETSPLATQLGITAPPVVVLVDGEGKVVDTAMSVPELDRSVQRLMR